MIAFLEAAEEAKQRFDEEGAPLILGGEEPEIAPWIHEEEIFHELPQAQPSRFREVLSAFIFVGLGYLMTSVRGVASSTIAAPSKGSDENAAKYSLFV